MLKLIDGFFWIVAASLAGAIVGTSILCAVKGEGAFSKAVADLLDGKFTDEVKAGGVAGAALGIGLSMLRWKKRTSPAAPSPQVCASTPERDDADASAGGVRCKTCDRGIIVRTSIYRNPFAVVIGVLFALNGVLVVFNEFSDHPRGTPITNSEVVLGVFAVVCLAIGFGLIGRRTVLRCTNCGAIIAAS